MNKKFVPINMCLDAIIIADSGADTFSGSSPLRLDIDGKQALIQVSGWKV
ncbi:hypothetical protein QUF75_16295 [Desulfococcaceae bacterium HSG7]|nr:hypothetical protein [Desulfococcaceae bacterium HSG7]